MACGNGPVKQDVVASLAHAHHLTEISALGACLGNALIYHPGHDIVSLVARGTPVKDFVACYAGEALVGCMVGMARIYGRQSAR